MTAQATNEQQQKDTAKKSVSSIKEQELRQAVERIYRRYGNDLAAFQRDVQRERELEKRG